jgi:hypothetical protein
MMVSAIISFQNYTALIYTLSHKLAEACQEATCLTFQERSIIYSVRKLMCTWKSCTGMLLKQNLHRIGVSFMPRVATSRRSVWRAPTPATSLVIDGCCTHLRRSMLRWRRGCHLLDVGTGDASTAWLARRYGRMPSHKGVQHWRLLIPEARRVPSCSWTTMIPVPFCSSTTMHRLCLWDQKVSGLSVTKPGMMDVFNAQVLGRPRARMWLLEQIECLQDSVFSIQIWSISYRCTAFLTLRPFFLLR